MGMVMGGDRERRGEERGEAGRVSKAAGRGRDWLGSARDVGGLGIVLMVMAAAAVVLWVGNATQRNAMH